MYKFEKVSGLVRLRSDRYASYHNYYHSGTPPDDDPIYKKIMKISENHKMVSKIIDSDFKMPATAEGFYFKSSATIKCVKNNKPCIINDLYECDAWCNFKVQPYDFIADGKRIVGISISILSAEYRK